MQHKPQFVVAPLSRPNALALFLPQVFATTLSCKIAFLISVIANRLRKSNVSCANPPTPGLKAPTRKQETRWSRLRQGRKHQGITGTDLEAVWAGALVFYIFPKVPSAFGTICHLDPIWRPPTATLPWASSWGHHWPSTSPSSALAPRLFSSGSEDYSTFRRKQIAKHQTSFLYAHKFNTLWFHNVHKPEKWGFASSLTLPA